jgi:hypothetical protein
MQKLATLLLMAIFATSVMSQRRTNRNRDAGQQKLVEEAADRVMRRFYERLEFADIYREDMSNQLKQVEVRITTGYVLRFGRESEELNEAAFRNIDFASMERGYLAAHQFDFLLSAIKFTYEGDRTKLREELEVKFKQYYKPMLEGTNWPIQTSNDLYNRFTANYEQLNSSLRKYVVPKNYNTDFYRSRIASFEQTKPPVSHIKDIFTLRQKIYVAQRETHHLYFIKENDSFKLLTVTSRVMD